MIIMDGMKRLLLLLGCSGALLCGADLKEVHTVYLMPMARGLDQYLANRISSQGVFRVVTDPKLADAVITDMIGEVFQTQLENFSPTPKPVEPEPVAAPETKPPAQAAVGPKTDQPAAPASPAAPVAPGAGDKSSKPAEAAAAESGTIEKPIRPARRRVSDTSSVVAMFGDTENKAAPPVSTFGRGKGTIFLVDAKSRQVVWSTFDPSKGNRNHDLDRTASDIVSRLKKDLKPKKEPKEQE